MRRLPAVVSSVPWRAMRVGLQESMVSTPNGTTARQDSGSAMPSKWFGLSRGSAGMSHVSISTISALSLPSDPPTAKPSKGSDCRYSALRRRSSRSTPPCTTAYMACLRGSPRWARSDRAIQRCESWTLSSRRSRVTWYGGSSSKGMMMSAPNCFCAATLDSGVRSICDPSRYDRNNVPFSETLRSWPCVFASPSSSSSRLRFVRFDLSSGPSSSSSESAREKT
mmetsp:Transcript_9798/g.32279  ORF Transcript_9798/g.32279 Transcript_9798/m.32279 type:complete len:224 (+) Transcript_9798:253-924(+)